MSIWRHKVKYRSYRRILIIVLLMIFWKNPVYGEQRMTQRPISGESGMRLYSDSEVDTLIEDLTGAAYEAIERAAGEAARATTLAALEREAAAIREAARLREENSSLKRGKVKTAVVTGVICFLGGLVIGAGSIAIVQEVR
jgi:hypothetical protein